MSTVKAMKALTEAKRHIGSWYLFGGAGPNRFDCSGLGQYSFKVAGVAIPRSTYTQYVAGKHVNRADVRPMDGIYLEPGPNGPGHVIWVVDHNTAIEAPHTNARVRYSNIDDRIRQLRLVTIRRFTPWDGTAPLPTHPIVKLGDHGSSVRLMQQRLIYKHYTVGPRGADGVFGSDTLKGLKAYQKAHGLKVDGVCNSDDWKKLLA